MTTTHRPMHGASPTRTLVVVGHITRAVGPGDRVAYSVKVSYPDYEQARLVTFVGNLSGVGPVVMLWKGGPSGGDFVTEPSRFGPFGRAWVRRFFGERAS